MSASYYEIYRNTSIGVALTDTLDEMVTQGRIAPQLAMKILYHYDEQASKALNEKVKSRLTFKGHLDTYRFCDEVWTFIIKDASFKFENETVMAEKIKIIACNSTRPGEGA
ncbi:transcription initiation factor IIA gamma chain [Protomyces lactucae-debilis]|uniref:Transcription initiation factor IIA subunit 2 n=1 Tax=Protomyces lactucae-debilis TaxID=2754530 RepID=A0A1Y2FP38_PROLT|nr:transcription initiation factor IIA gamma chain [Protomyces lactucae-debilis]ORY85733.1 transcription initiation factor IIA gamma chain [Protomyces lactucae-debilis]